MGIFLRGMAGTFVLKNFMENIEVAIIEDTDEIREAMRVLINGSSGFSCTHVFSNAADAIRELPDLYVHVVLIDINMPGMSGIEALPILKAKMPDALFMVETVYEDDYNIFNALSAGASGYVLKRTSPAQLLEAIRELYNGGSPMSSEVARRVVATFQKKNKNEAAEILTDRERNILDYLAKGYIYKEIATELDISYETVKKHLQNIYGKLQVQNKVEALNKIFPK